MISERAEKMAGCWGWEGEEVGGWSCRDLRAGRTARNGVRKEVGGGGLGVEKQGVPGSPGVLRQYGAH